MHTDTTFWIDLLQERRRGQAGPATQFIVVHRAFRFQISLVTWGELAEGFARSADLVQFIHRVKVLPLPQQVAWEASRIARELAANGTRLGENDNWIAATARTWGLRVVTRDDAFSRVPKLTVVSY